MASQASILTAPRGFATPPRQSCASWDGQSQLVLCGSAWVQPCSHLAGLLSVSSNAIEVELPMASRLRAVISQHFRTASPASPSDVTAALWNAAVTSESYAADAEKYQSAILEQYKLCVEMADRISARRALANAFFLTLNSAALTTIGAFWKDGPRASVFYLIPPLLLLLALCLAWFRLVRSYRQLNSGKYAVIGALKSSCQRLRIGRPNGKRWGRERTKRCTGRSPISNSGCHLCSL